MFLPLRSVFKLWLPCLMLNLATALVLRAQGLPEPKPNPMDTEALTINAARFRFTGSPDKAASIYRQILEQHPSHALAAFELARLLLDKNQPDSAITYAQIAATSEPLNIWYQRLLADAYQRMDRFDRAAQVFEGLVQSFPLELSFYSEWASLCQKAGQRSNALKVYEQAETQFGVQQNLSRAQYAIYLETGDTKKAAKVLERLCNAFPGNTAFLHDLAAFYEKQQDALQAQSTYRRILQADSTDARALAALTTTHSAAPTDDGLNALVQNRNITAALKIEKIGPLVTAMPSPGPTEVARLLPIVQQLDQLHPGLAEVNALLAELLQLNHQPEAALEKWLYALKLDETNFRSWEKTLRLLESLGSIPPLYRQASTALDIFPNKPLLYYLHALACFNQYNLPSATRSISQALLMGSTDTGLQIELLSLQALVQQAANNPSASTEAIAKASAIQKDHPILLARQARLLLLSNQPDEAANLAQRALSTPASAEATQVLAGVAYARQQWTTATSLLQSIPYTEHPQRLELLGDIAFRSGQPEQALTFWNQAKLNGSKSPLLLKKIMDKQL